MKFLIATDSFKGSLSSHGAASCIEKGINKVFENADIIKVLAADGGEGTIDAILSTENGEKIFTHVHDPLGREIESCFGLLPGHKAIIEMATASGLTLLNPEERNPLLTSTYGTGELIKQALSHGCKEIMVFIGGSATNDGGAGMMEALGVTFYDKNHTILHPTGGNLNQIKEISFFNLDKRIQGVKFIVASDVTNSLLGDFGASSVFAPQKGATPEMVQILENNLIAFSALVGKIIGKNIGKVPGSGAAGGLGFGMMAFLNAEMKKGVEVVLEAVKLEELLTKMNPETDLVITGEGKMDFQTHYGKTPYAVAQLAKKYNLPVIAFCGGLGDNFQELYAKGFDSIFPITDKPLSLQEAMENAEILLENATERAMKVLKLGKKQLF